MTERWRPVVGFEDLYEVSSEGRVRSLDRRVHHPLKPERALRRGRILGHGGSNRYASVSLARDGSFVVRAVHVLVAEAFHGPRPPDHQAAHNNGKRRDNRAKNLTWKTCEANHADKRKHGTMPIGERNHGAKLTEAAVKVLRAAAKRGASLVPLAKKFGVAPCTAYHAAKGETWGHV